MKLISLSMENFMPFKGQTKIAFPQEEERNVMMVFGENMRGKTSLLNALRWGFYGKALGRHLREIPLHDLHNKEAAREGDWTMEVRIEFSAGGHHYTLLRRAQKKPLVVQPSRPEDYSLEVGLQKDSVAVSGHAIESEINRYAPEQVSRFFLFDGELLQEYEELLIEGSEQGKGIKAAIEQVLGVPTLINGRSDLGTILRTAQRQQSKDLAHVAGLELQASKQASIQSKLDALESDVKRLGDKLAQTKGSRAVLDDDLEKVDSVHRAKIRLDATRERQKRIVSEQDSIRQERLLLLRDAWRDVLKPKLEARSRLLAEKKDKLSLRAQEKNRLEAQAENTKKLLDTSKCPTCEQTLESALRGRMGRVLGELEVQLSVMAVDQKEMSDITAELRTVNDLLSKSVAGRISEIESVTRKLEIELTRVENEAEALESEIRGYDTAEIARKRVLRDGLLREEGQLARDIEIVTKSIDSEKRELAIIARTFQDTPSARVSRSTAMVKVTSSLERVFSESIERLRDELRKHVEARASEAFKSLTTQKSYSGLEINKNYGLKILDERGSHVTVRSAGAEQIVALSLIDGLARTGRAAGPVVMDTPFGRLDLQHRDNILRYLPTTTSQLILLVHGGEIRRPRDLEPVASRIGASYEIREVNARHSRIERMES